MARSNHYVDGLRAVPVFHTLRPNRTSSPARHAGGGRGACRLLNTILRLMDNAGSKSIWNGIQKGPENRQIVFCDINPRGETLYETFWETIADCGKISD
jgi:hypothetical protein